MLKQKQNQIKRNRFFFFGFIRSKEGTNIAFTKAWGPLKGKHSPLATAPQLLISCIFMQTLQTSTKKLKYLLIFYTTYSFVWY